MRVSVDYRSASKENYAGFCKKYPHIKLTFDQWRNILYGFNESFKNYLLETGAKGKLPFGFGEFAITKKKRKRVVTDPATGKDHINLPVDWKKSKEKGKKIYILNYHTEGYFFGWRWFKRTARLKFTDLWWFKPSRVTSRLLAHYIKTDNKYQFKYCEWPR